MRKLLLLVLFVSCSTIGVYAQVMSLVSGPSKGSTSVFSGPLWSGILDPKRAIDWSSAGATIVNRSTPCGTQPTLLAGIGNNGANRVSMNNAIAAGVAAGGNCVINEGAGTWYFDSAWLILSTSNTVVQGKVTIRGAGANSTFNVWTALGAAGATIYAANNNTNYSGGPQNVASWTAGYSQGTTSITLNTVTLGSIQNLHAGSLLILDQLDNTADPGNIIMMQETGSNGSHSTLGGSGIGRPGTGTCDSTNTGNGCRAQMQQVSVTSCVGANSAACDSGTATAPYTVVITPGIYAPNWNAGQSPGAWWSTGVALTGIGIENMSIDAAANNGTAEFYWTNVINSWIKGVRGISTAMYAHAKIYQSSHITIRDSYFYGSGGASNSYGLDPGYGSCDNLIENNITQHIATGYILEGGCGNVFGYNYAVDNYYTPGGNWQQGDVYSHGPNYYNLIEGHEGIEVEMDDIHDPNFMETVHRSYFSGFDPGGGNTKTLQTSAVQLNAWTRYDHFVGNVLGGANGISNNYSAEPAASGTCGSLTVGNKSVFNIGWSGNGGTMFAPLGTCPSGLGAAFSINNDTLVSSTIMRWGNYDAVTAANRFCTANGVPIGACTADEKGDGAATYPALASPSSILPASFYLGAKPAFWNSGIPYPPIGPDVTGGSIGSVGGHAYHNPAGNCYLNVMGGAVNGSSGPLTFDPMACYYL